MTIKGKGKGKEVAGKSSAGKRKNDYDDDKTGGRKGKNRGVLQFFEDAAYVEDDDEDSDDSDFSDGFFDEDFDTLPMGEPAKGHGSLPFIPKEEVMDEEEFDRMMEERYGECSRFVTFAGDEFDDKAMEPNSLHTGVKELTPTIWKVKCTVGRERLSAFCLMQKFADLKSLGTKLQIISAFAVDHIKGFVYIEAEKQFDINEACNGISGIYVTRAQPVPKNEVFHLFSVRSKSREISEGSWARIKSGHYKGDLAQVVAVNNTRKKVTVKLIPRIDFQALAAKFGGGYSRQKAAVPAPRLITSSELEEFRPLIQLRRDRDTGKVFEVLDGMLLKDGYVFKKVSPDSLTLWGVVPTEEELLKFGPSENNESNDLEWLSQLYGDSKKKRVTRADKGVGKGEKGESSSGSGVVNGFELYDLVCFGKKDFGVIVGMDKDDSYKILKESSDGPVAVTIDRHEIKSGLFDLKLSAQDQHAKTILVNDSVRVLEGPSKGRQGIVKHIYRGIVFLYDENVEENGGYFTSKSNMCEKVKLTVDDCSGKDSEPAPFVFEDQPSSPTSPLSPKRPWQEREKNREFSRGDKDNMFSIGQTLRIRIGPLKGYLCRVIALRRSDVTVKLDSRQKVLTVKCEHLSEVQGKNTASSTSGDPDSSSFKPFDLLGTEGSSGGWMDGAGTSTGGGGGWNAGGTGGGWNAGGTSAERSEWSNQSAPSLLKPESTSNPFSSDGADDPAWETKNTSNQNSSWGAAVENKIIASDTDQSGGWGNGGGSWGQAEHKIGSMGDDNQNSKWKSKANDLDENQPSGWDSKSNRNTTKASEEKSSGWSSLKMSNECSATGWGQGNGFKSGSDDGGNWKSGTSGVKEVGNPAGASNNWNTSISSSQVKSGWNQKSTEDDKEEKSKDQGGWSAGKASDGSAAGLGQASGWKGGSSAGENLDSAWGSKKSSSSNTGWKSGLTEEAQGGWSAGKASDGSAAGLGQASGWKGGSSAGENPDSAWGSRKSSSSNTGWKSGLTEEAQEGSNWGKMNIDSSAVAENQDSDCGKASNWNSVSGNAGGGGQGNGWGQRSNWKSGSTNDSIEKKPDRDSSIRWDQDNGKSGSADGPSTPSNWGTRKSGSSSGNGNQNSNWSSGCPDAGSHDSDLGKKTNWNSAHCGNQASDLNNSNWNSGSGNSNQTSNWGKNSSWNANNSSGNARNENKDSNWSSGHTDSGNQDSNWGKKSNWNSGNNGNQTSDPNNSNWNSGSGDSNQNSNLGKNSNWNSNKSSWSAGNENKNSNWSSGHTDPGNQDSNWGKKSNWNSGSGDTSQNTNWRSNSNWNTGNASGGVNEGLNENSDDGAGGGNWRGGYRGRNGSDRGGFRGRGFRGRGERGGFGGRGEGGGFGGRGDRGGFGGRGRSDRGGFGGRWGSDRGGGRGRGRSDQPGGWNNRRDSGEHGSSDWKKGGDNVEGWKNSTGSGAWNQESSDKDGQSWSQGNADKERPSWNQGGGTNKQWQSGSSANGGATDNWNSNGSKQTAEAKTGDIDGQSWSQGNANKERPSWNQGGGTNKQWQGGSSASGGATDNWNSNGSKQTAEAKDGAGWTSHGDQGSSWKKSGAIEETNIQEGGSGGTGDRVPNWGQSSAADKGQSSISSESADGAAGSWSKSTDGGNKGGW
ncbi:protein RNA-directed DNA methylation 3 [Gastrolobium bilobum]|uniref:protein RNA-directed DNA methylation 3 n=1 Tax=Gastrolobium bilobum TaxID=150636 RepID=UPI002AAFC55F|nr:protein RNA-directed DNA methylation 3 [Gastrolobium bilobum]